MRFCKIVAVCVGLGVMGALLAGCGGGGSNGSSGNGNAIVFMRDVAGDKQIWIMRLDGTDKTLLVNGPGRDIQGQLSPDGRKLVYVEQYSGHSIIKVKDLHTGATTTLVDDAGGGGNDFAPAWSPDGTKIAYHDEYGDDNIHVMDSDGSDDFDLTTGGNNDRTAIWSPDGSKVVFDRGWNGSICQIDSDGTDFVTLVAEGTDSYGQPWYLWDGRVIFTRNPSNETGDLLLCRADGSDVVALTDTTDFMEFSPSATGSRIAYAYGDTGGDDFIDIYIATLSGNSLTNKSNLTDDTADKCWRPKIGYLDESNFEPGAM